MTSPEKTAALFVALVMLPPLIPSTFAQAPEQSHSTRAQLQGRVVDHITGAPLAGVRIGVDELPWVEEHSDEQGYFAIYNLPPDAAITPYVQSHTYPTTHYPTFVTDHREAPTLNLRLLHRDHLPPAVDGVAEGGCDILATFPQSNAQGDTIPVLGPHDPHRVEPTAMDFDGSNLVKSHQTLLWQGIEASPLPYMVTGQSLTGNTTFQMANIVCKGNRLIDAGVLSPLVYSTTLQSDPQEIP